MLKYRFYKKIKYLDKLSSMKEDDNQNNFKSSPPSLKDEHHNAINPDLEKLKENDNFARNVEKIFNKTKNYNEIHSRLILLIKKHLKIKKKGIEEDKVGVEADEKEHNITEFCRTLTKDLNQELDDALCTVDKKDKNRMLNIVSIQNIKNIIKNFIIYQIYKIMNPKRIAGETKKDNYMHNMMRGGQKLASKYEGGKESDLNKYGSAEVSKIEQQAKAWNKKDTSKLER